METTDSARNLTPLHDAADDSPTYRTPPHNFEAEMALLGAVLTNNRAYERVSEFLLPGHFADPAHGRIYEATGRLIEAGQIADPVTLKNYFEQEGTLDDIGGTQYLARLVASALTIINAPDYGRTIHDRYLRRELINLAEDISGRAYSFDLDKGATDQIEEAEQNLYDLATTGQYESGFQTFAKTLKNAINTAEVAYKREGRVTGIATGFIDLDRILGGLQPSDLIVLAGRPSMGKTALATNIAFHTTKAYREERDEDGISHVMDGAVVGFFSLEMSAEQLAIRILAEESRVASEKIRRGQLTNEDFLKMVQASRKLHTVPFFIDDSPGLSVSNLRTRARRLKRQHNLSLIIVDYLQLVQPSSSKRYDSRVQEISEITRGLKMLAKELDVPVLALSQLSRAVEQRDDKRPQLADLRESGTIEQDADIVMLIFREEYYWKKSNPEPKWTNPDEDPKEDFYKSHKEWEDKYKEVKGQAEVIIAKHRQGPTDTINLYFEENFTKFDNLAQIDHLPDVDL